MSPVPFSCVICGATIGVWDDLELYPSTFWLGEFRGLYESSDGLVLTGVGLHNDERSGIYSAPKDPGGRWDDQSYEKGNEDNAFGAMRQRPIHGKHGFIFHDACWSLLIAAYHPNNIPIQRLYDTCRSVPIVETVLDWGHDYGGLIRRYHDNCYPWEETTIEDDMEVDLANHNPLSVSHIQHIFKQTPKEPPYLASMPPQRPISQDRFSRLPPELVVAIAKLLPINDFLNCRLVSAAFWPIFHHQSFWASRFIPTGNAERSWLFEAHNTAAQHDWRYLFTQTTSSHLSPGLLNRKRVWALIEKLILTLEVCQGPFDLLPQSWQETKYSWGDAAADMKPLSTELQFSAFSRNFKEGARAIYHTGVILPSQSLKFIFYFITLGETQFLSGIEVVTIESESFLLGYRSEASAYHSLACNSSTFRGFVVAIGPRGIQAIQVHSDSSVSPWYGNTRQCPQTRGAFVADHISAIRVAFDGCKIVSIGVARGCATGIVEAEPQQSSSQLYDRAIWFPDIPPSHLCVNQASFPQLKLHTTTYHPLSWVSFGGPGGIHLQNLSKITMTIAKNAIFGIRFYYIDSTHVDELGRHPYHLPEYIDYATTQEFCINGPDGERIESITASLEVSVSPDSMAHYKHGSLNRLKLSTNRGRILTFGPTKTVAIPGCDVREEHLKPEDGTVITGFYVGQVKGYGITSLGIVSEIVEAHPAD